MDAPTLPAGHDTVPVVVALSGGLDSTVLLHLLAGATAIRRTGLRALHVHHGLHADADAWAAHCQSACSALGIGLRVVEVQVDRASGLGPEAAARTARHAAFERELKQDEVLALAHHRDDQAETFLLRALRASGPDGLAAMHPWRRLGHGWLWRPLLDTPREALLRYAQSQGLHWIEDPSNFDHALDRNFLRHRVLPLLRERWPQADAAFAHSARLQADTVDLLAQEDAKALASVRTPDPGVLSIEALQRLPTARRARALRQWTAQLGLPPLPAAGIVAIESGLMDAAPDAVPEFAWADAVVQRWRDLLHAERRRGPLPDDFRQDWNGREPLALPTGDILRFEPLAPVGATAVATGSLGSRLPSLLQDSNAGFVVHARRGGERIVLPGRTHSHALKHVLQELGVPPWERKRLPLVSGHDGSLLAVGDLAYSADFDAWLRELGTRLVWNRL